MGYSGNSPLNFIPYAMLEYDENSLRSYGTNGFIDVSPFGRILNQGSLENFSISDAIFHIEKKEDYMLVGHTFKFNPTVLFNVYGTDESDFLYEIDLGIEVSPDDGYPIAVNINEDEYYVFVDDDVIRFNVTPNGYTEVTRFNENGPFFAAAVHEDVVYAGNYEGDIFRSSNDDFDSVFYEHGGVIHDILAMEEGLFVVGTKNGQNTMTKIDYQGNVLFSKTYDQEIGMDIAPTADGGFVFTGKGNTSQGFITRVDKDGNEIWTYDEMEEIGVSVTEDDFGNFYALGMTVNQGTSIALLVKINGEGLGGDRIIRGRNFPLAVNNIEAGVSSGGTIFLDDDQNAAYFYPRGGETATIFASGLWLGGTDPGGNLKLAAQGYQVDEDFQMGPIGPYNSFFNRIWSVKKEFIQKFRNDIADGSKDDDWLIDILEWPAKGNTIYNADGDAIIINTDLAPFEDVNNDGNYNPYDGDYPKIKGDQMLWWVFNDNKVHTGSGGDILSVEVMASLFAFSCSDNIVVDNSTFLDFQIANKGLDEINNFRLAYWIDPDLGCFEDDYIGSIPNANTAYVYNADGQDGDGNGNCAAGVPTFDDEIPIQTAMFVDRTMDNFIYYNNGSVGGPWPQGTTDPQTAPEFYNYISGLWRDGTLLTPGGTGYSPSTPAPVPHAFPANPANVGGWSLCEENVGSSDRRMIMSSAESDFLPGAVKHFRLAFTTFPDVDYPCPDVDYIEAAQIELQNDIDLGALDYNLDLGPDILNPSGTITLDAGAGAEAYLWSTGATEQSIDVMDEGTYSVTVTTHFGCEVEDEIILGLDVSTQNIVDNTFIKVYPNPSRDQVTIEWLDYQHSDYLLEIYDVNGQLKSLIENNQSGKINQQINIQDWASGMYFLKFKMADKIFVERLVVQ